MPRAASLSSGSTALQYSPSSSQTASSLAPRINAEPDGHVIAFREVVVPMTLPVQHRSRYGTAASCRSHIMASSCCTGMR